MKGRGDDEWFGGLVVRFQHRRWLRGGLRKVRKAELVALAHDNSAINRVLKLANIAGPLKLRQMSHRLTVDSGNGPIFFGAEPRQKMPQQMRDVFATHP